MEKIININSKRGNINKTIESSNAEKIKKHPKRQIDDLTDAQIVSLVLSVSLNVVIEKNDMAFQQLMNGIRMDASYKLGMSELADSMPQIVNSITDNDRKQIDKIINKIFKKYGKIETADDLLLLSEVIDGFGFKVDTIFEFERLSSTQTLSSSVIRKSDIEEILFCYFLKAHVSNDDVKFTINDIDDNVDIEDITKFLIESVFLRLLIKEYKVIKEFYFNNSQESMIIKNQNLQKQNDKLSNQINSLRKDIEALRIENKRLERHNKNLLQSSLNNESNKTEVNKLREFIFNYDKHQDYYDGNVDYSKLHSLSGVIVGGTQSWQRKMKDVFHNCNFIGMDNMNFDEKIIKNIVGQL